MTLANDLILAGNMCKGCEHKNKHLWLRVSRVVGIGSNGRATYSGGVVGPKVGGGVVGEH